MKKQLCGWILVLVALVWQPGLGAQEQHVEFTQRYNLRQSVNKRHVGIVHGYSYGTWDLGPPDSKGTMAVFARYYLADESNTDLQRAPKSLSGAYTVNFRLLADGSASELPNGPVPIFRGYPSRIPKDIQPGENWRAYGALSVDPRNQGVYNTIPLYIEYTYLGLVEWNGRLVPTAKAKFAVRYRPGKEPLGDPKLLRGEGTRDVMIHYDPETGFPLMMRETVGHETWNYQDGSTIENNGFVLTFWKGALRYDSVVERVEQKKEESKKAETVLVDEKIPDVRISQDERGLALTLENLRFVADQAVLLPGEELRMGGIIKVLKTAPSDKHLLVVGHTAAVGSVESQDLLSLQRAKLIVDLLVKGGIEAGRLLYDGRGGRDPLADNATEAGRATNRRVEIVILD